MMLDDFKAVDLSLRAGLGKEIASTLTLTGDVRRGRAPVAPVLVYVATNLKACVALRKRRCSGWWVVSHGVRMEAENEINEFEIHCGPGLPVSARISAAVTVNIVHCQRRSFGWTVVATTGPSAFVEWAARRTNHMFGGVVMEEDRFVSAADVVLPDATTEQSAFETLGIGFVAPEDGERDAELN